MTRSIRPTSAVFRLGIAVATATAAIALVATPAFAHVEAQGETAATGITTVTFAFTHGCAGSPTTSLKVQLPAATTEVTAESPTGWTSSSDATTLTWTGGSIPDATPGEFRADMRLVGAKGDTVFLPTIQGCAQGEETWIELSPDPEAENAAPRFVLTETVAAGPNSTTTAPSVTTTTSAANTRTSAEEADAKVVSDSENSNLGVLILGIALLVIVGGAVILFLRNRRPSDS